MYDDFRIAFPWTAQPCIANAPMGGFAGGRLAAAVTNAGGLGFIGADNDMDALDKELEIAKQLCPDSTGYTSEGVLPIGVGLLVFITPLLEAMEVLRKHRPAAVWLYAAEDVPEYATWAKHVRLICSADIFVQTGSVSSALEIADKVHPDVIVLQGIDAGGHGMQRGASITALIPEAKDALRAAGHSDIRLMAAGGIADGRGVAAALALGAGGVVMGTRFLASEEVNFPHKGFQDAVIKARDGGQSTVRYKTFDDVAPNGNIWPKAYDGRAIRNATSADHEAGMAIEENRRLYGEAKSKEGGGFVESPMRGTVWCGTGVGLVNELLPAKEILRRVRDELMSVITDLYEESIEAFIVGGNHLKPRAE